MIVNNSNTFECQSRIVHHIMVNYHETVQVLHISYIRVLYWPGATPGLLSFERRSHYRSDEGQVIELTSTMSLEERILSEQVLGSVRSGAANG